MKETKFRRLRRDELEEVKPQFVRFLSMNGINAEYWQRLKADEPSRADAMILQFSQTVFAGVIKEVKFLVQRRPHDLRTYRTGPDKIEMRGLLISGETSVDLTDAELPPREIFERLRKDGATPKLYSAERAYLPIGRDQDIFLRMEEGALIDNGELFGLLDGLRG